MTLNVNREASLYHLNQAFTQRGCPLCRLLAGTAEAYVDSLLWEMVNYPDLREEINRSRGYCNPHAWLLAKSGAALGVAIILHDVIDTLLDELRGQEAGLGFKNLWGSWNSQSNAKLVDKLSPQKPCPVCVKVDLFESQYIKLLVKNIAKSDDLSSAFTASDGLCLPHFRQTLEQAAPGQSIQALITAQQTVWQRLEHELSEFIRKNDYQYKGKFGGERDSWLRAIEAVSGAVRPVGNNADLPLSKKD